MGKSMGGHEAPIKGNTVVWLTPPKIIGALGVFDLDPCCAPNPRPWATANHHFDGTNYDGIKEPWFGRVWLNPPYDEGIGEWLKKMAEHKNGICLIFARTDIKAWHEWVWPFAHSILFFEGRLHFHLPDGSRAPRNAGAPSVLISYSEFDTAILRVSGIKGALINVQSY